MYNRFLNKPLLQGAYNIPFSLIDKGLLEQVGPTGLSKATMQLGQQLARAQTGRITDYAAVLLLASLLCAVVLNLYVVSPVILVAALPLREIPSAVDAAPFVPSYVIADTCLVMRN